MLSEFSETDHLELDFNLISAPGLPCDARYYGLWSADLKGFVELGARRVVFDELGVQIQRISFLAPGAGTRFILRGGVVFGRAETFYL